MREPEHHGDESDPYWTDEVQLGEVYFGRDNRVMTLRSHISEKLLPGCGSDRTPALR